MFVHRRIFMVFVYVYDNLNSSHKIGLEELARGNFLGRNSPGTFFYLEIIEQSK